MRVWMRHTHAAAWDRTSVREDGVMLPGGSFVSLLGSGVHLYIAPFSLVMGSISHDKVCRRYTLITKTL